MTKNLAIFEGQKIRRIWDENREKWYFSIVDVISVLTDQSEHRKAQSYWTTLKNRLKDEGSEVVTKCDQLKMQAIDGKFYPTDATDTEGIFRIIQSIPSQKAEPFKLWLARVGYERVEESEDPEKAINLNKGLCHAELVSASLAYASEYLKQVEGSRNKFGMTI